ncbi:SDR family oxidoreductase [Paenibacillus sediminis]|uniref:NAD(P)-dependent dehydrogenase (Short-subunit alcohol dehydrogenase family) n=1 Tax=Paenibacillus sediminis TaxID=664909 RepID=A0ABS4H6T9_9BACL|nr:SDR family oxidoreductase [Paenibacillus sediminis]MBP1938082.1 NAD(P)-dependent dehydrogenase (short-subunit alcohol dehydrogenase family) [Paenibacillus sediminis]
MDLGLTEKIVLVTGGSNGIGEAIATQFGKEKAYVVITYRTDVQGAHNTVKKIEDNGGQAAAVQMDFSNRASIQETVNKVSRRYGHISVLVNNAVSWPSRQGMNNLIDYPDDDWMSMFDINLKGTYLITKEVLPLMQKQPWGRIVHISSDIALDGMAGASAYAAMKASLHGLSRTLSLEFARNNIYSNVVVPGFTLTERALRHFPKEFIKGLIENHPAGRLGAPEDIGNAVVYLGSAANRFINGEVIRVTGGHIGQLA